MNNKKYKKIVSQQSDLWRYICNNYASSKDIEMFFVNYEKSFHYLALTVYELADYIEFKRLIKDVLNKTEFDFPPELVNITVEKYMSDYIQEEIDIYS